MKILAVETATEACSAALWIDGAVAERYEIAPQRHGHLILPMVQSLLAEAELDLGQLDAVAFGRGPGSFTGVRIATGVAQGLAYAKDLPVVPVSTLATLAQGCVGERLFCALDARMGEIYVGLFERDAGDILHALGDELVSPPGAISVPEGAGWCGVGSGFAAYPDVLAERMGSSLAKVYADRLPQARHTAALGAQSFRAGQAVPAHAAQPVYVRDRVAEKKRV